MRFAILAVLMMTAPAFAQSAPAKMAAPPGEEDVDPYMVSNANAGATPFEGAEMLKAFHGKEGIGRIVDDLVDAVQKDKRTEEVFHASDFVRLRRTLKEQVCYILDGGCEYTGRDMKKVHDDHGVDVAEFNALVELLQEAMDREGVAFGAQNRLLAKLAPMRRDVVRR
jgi:hemoglobin